MRNFRTTLVILLCFFLTSDGYLAWLDRLINYVSPMTADILTMDVAYPLQALGILIICLLLRRFKNLAKREFIAGAVILFAVSVIPAVLANNMWAVIISGLVMNLICGVVAGYYLYMLVADTDGHRRGLLFALGYAGAAVLSWIFSYFLGERAYNSDVTLITCFVVTILACIVIFIPVKASTEPAQKAAMQATPKLIGLAIVVLVLINLVQSVGFTFPSEDIGNGISLELMRLMYAAGLIIAGFVTDRNRKFGSFITLVALIIPFVILALQGMNVSSAVLWCIAYLVTGFFSIYRISLFTDISKETSLLFLAGFGLMSGRMGEAIGSAVNHMLSGKLVVLIIITVVLYVVTIGVFILLYKMIYTPEMDSQREEEKKLYQFAKMYNLSSREVDVMRLLTTGKSTSELAEALFISESTVKFHVHNLIQKTGCKNRNDLVTLYMTGSAKE